MKFWCSLLILLICPIAEAQIFKICELDPNVYQKEVFPKIESGIPFELMAVVLGNNQVLARKVIHVSHNLWDEVVILKSHQQILSKFQLKSGASQICKHLTVETAEAIPHGTKIKVRLLLNPMWSERLARLHLSTRADLENKKLIGIDWKKIAEEMPSEKVLMGKELDL